MPYDDNPPCSAAMLLNHIRTLDVTEPLSAGHAFVSSASGLVRLGDMLCVLADDEHHLAIFGPDPQKPGRLSRLLGGSLPQDASARKKVKPDFEILLALPLFGDVSGYRLLAMGSGSAPRRMRGALVDITSGGMVSAITILDLKPLFAALAPFCNSINLEGAIICADRLILFNRGNMDAPVTMIFSASLSAILAGEAIDVALEKEYILPFIGDVPLTVTDACRLDDGDILLSAVAEATGDAYADGAIIGAAFMLLDEQYNLLRIEAIDPICKIEGVSAQAGNNCISVLCVSDADDPNRPSSLYGATLAI
jgi:hypothetical protein